MLAACGSTASSGSGSSAGMAGMAGMSMNGGSMHQTANLTTGCVKKYEPGVDYFPSKATVQYASNFSVTYHDNYKVLKVNQPWQGAAPESFVLVQCGTPTPKLTGALAKAEVIQIPVQRVDDYPLTHMLEFQLLGDANDIVGVSDTAMATNPVFVKRIKAGEITQFAPAGTTNAEEAIATRAQLFITEGSGPPTAADKEIEAAGIPEVPGADWLEKTPIGQAEWIKFVSLFLNKEAAANEVFMSVVSSYDRLQALAAKEKVKPTVFDGFEDQGQWYVVGGRNFDASFIRAAGATPVLGNTTSTGMLTDSFETVVAAASKADFWISDDYDPSWASLAHMSSVDPRITAFKAFKAGEVWGTTLKANTSGGNGYWEWVGARPDLVLADLLAIFHPSLEPNHSFSFYGKIPAS
jgi:iron complex transport system substrate-binding protein